MSQIFSKTIYNDKGQCKKIIQQDCHIINKCDNFYNHIITQQ